MAYLSERMDKLKVMRMHKFLFSLISQTNTLKRGEAYKHECGASKLAYIRIIATCKHKDEMSVGTIETAIE